MRLEVEVPAPTLTLKVVESQSLEIGMVFTINTTGSVDNVVYVGTDAGGDSPSLSKGIIIPKSEASIGPKHVAIQYRKDSKKYYVKDNGSESGTYLRIDKPLELKQGYILAFGESNMAVATEEGNGISFKFLSGSKDDQTL